MIKTIKLSLVLLILGQNSVIAQTTCLPIESIDNLLLDRLETRSGRLCDSLYLSYRSELRNRAVSYLYLKQYDSAATLSPADKYNIDGMMVENSEWLSANDSRAIALGIGTGKGTVTQSFYKDRYDLYQLRSKNFFLSLNPVVNFMVINEQGTTKNTLALSAYGAELRSKISSRLGFYFFITENRENTPAFITKYVATVSALPGIGRYDVVDNKASSYQYLYKTGYVDYSLVKDHVDVAIGSGKNFIGDGIHSLFLSDNAANTNYIKINTRIWKFNYKNLFLELTPHFINNGTPPPNTYATMHHISLNVTKWLNIGIFETVLFNRPNSVEVAYFNPIIFYSYLEHYNGSPDKEFLGFNCKAIAAKHLQFYGQFLLGEFTASKFFANTGYWGNKYGFQLGGKYFDAFTIKNLDLQGEINAVRPFTYAHNDTIVNYTNYNQPLGDPLGSGFIELTGIARYQPIKDLYFSIKGTYYTKGADTGNKNYGNDVFLNYNTRYADYGVPWISGVKTNCMMLGANISYQLFRNLFIDVGGAHRRFVSDVTNKPITSSTGTTFGNSTTTWYYLGIRLNIARRAYDKYF